jgi:hypothetical protein
MSEYSGPVVERVIIEVLPDDSGISQEDYDTAREELKRLIAGLPLGWDWDAREYELVNLWAKEDEEYKDCEDYEPNGEPEPVSEDVKRDLISYTDGIAKLESGMIEYYGVQAKAEVSYPCGNGSRRLEWLTSGGLWGISVDSSTDEGRRDGREYLSGVAEEETADLIAHLRTFGVTRRGAEFDVKDKEECLTWEAEDKIRKMVEDAMPLAPRTYRVLVQVVHTYAVEVEADSPERAYELADGMQTLDIEAGKLLDVAVTGIEVEEEL